MIKKNIMKITVGDKFVQIDWKKKYKELNNETLCKIIIEVKGQYIKQITETGIKRSY